SCCTFRFQFITYGVFRCWSTANREHWLLILHWLPAEEGKMGPAELQLIRLPSLDSWRNEVIVPLGDCRLPFWSTYGTPLGLRLRPPPLNMKVRIDGCSKMMPYPDRNTVLPVPKTSQTTPTRGDRLL